jgi:hypothetical protein
MIITIDPTDNTKAVAIGKFETEHANRETDEASESLNRRAPCRPMGQVA